MRKEQFLARQLHWVPVVQAEHIVILPL